MLARSVLNAVAALFVLFRSRARGLVSSLFSAAGKDIDDDLYLDIADVTGRCCCAGIIRRCSEGAGS